MEQISTFREEVVTESGVGMSFMDENVISKQYFNREYANFLESILMSYGKQLESLQKKIEQIEIENKKTRDMYETICGARLEIIEKQKMMIERYRRWRFKERLKRFFRPRLGLLYHYEPISLKIPKHYRNVLALNSPPKISIVTPSYNQGAFIERTILSVISQKYPNLEYIVQDGGSADSTQEVLQKYETSLKHWSSAKDKGQSNAINLGFQHATGEIMAYLNSDDLLLPGTLNYVAKYFQDHPEVDVVYGHRVLVDEYDKEIGRWVLPPHDNEILSWADYIPQETLFWRRSIWEKAGGKVDENFQFAMDWDLLLRFREAGAKFVRLPRFLGMFRVHVQQKSSAQIAEIGLQEMRQLRIRCNGYELFTEAIQKRIRPYILKHLLYHKLYRLGLLNY